MYAVIKTGGKQYKVARNDVILVEKLPGEAGAAVQLDEVLLVGDDKGQTVGSPLVAGASVAATVLEQTRGEKIIVFKKKRRKNYRRKAGHRQDLTALRITDILTGGKKKAAAKAEAPKAAEKKAAPKKAAVAPVSDEPEVIDIAPDMPVAEAAPEKAKPAAKKPAAKKAAAKKAEEKKAPAKKPAAKKAEAKPTAKKAPAKKTEAKKASAKPAAKKAPAKKAAAKKPAAKKKD
jgi:large subunit ribosomal protein L21